MPFFKDRADAGRQLSDRVGALARSRKIVLLALFAGGIPVAVELADRLHLSLDVILVERLTVPDHDGIIFGAVSSAIEVIDDRLVQRYSVPEYEVTARLAAARATVTNERRQLDLASPTRNLSGQTVLLVDDGLTDTRQLAAALMAVRSARPAHLVLAAPTLTPGAADVVYPKADDVICAIAPQPFVVAERWYGEAAPVSAGEARRLLQRREEFHERKQTNRDYLRRNQDV